MAVTTLSRYIVSDPVLLQCARSSYPSISSPGLDQLMKLFATLYQDEDVSALVATLLRVRGIDITTAREHDEIANQLLYV